MNPELRASDDERERTAALLREHAAAGRLTMDELAERTAAAYAARTVAELEALRRDLPAAAAPAAPSRRRPTRLLLAAFAEIVRDGRLRIGRRVFCVVSFASGVLDLRRASFERERATVVALVSFGSVDVYVSDEVEVDVLGLPLFGSLGSLGNDPPPHAERPSLRVVALVCFGSVDVWRTPAAWAERRRRDVRRALRRGGDAEDD